MTTCAKWLMVVVLLMPAGAAPAQTAKEKVQLVGIGHVRMLDTYLSPEHYSGPELRFIGQTTWLRPEHHWARQMTNDGSLQYTEMRSGDAQYIGGMYHFRYSWQRKWKDMTLGQGTLSVRTGGGPELYLGFLYNTRNGNNPAQARVALRVTPEVDAQYQFDIHGKQQVVRWNIAFPLVGLQFSPNYGQSYYEIFTRGNYDHNICPTWIGNMPTLTQRITWTLPLRHVRLTVGYLGDYQQVKVNHLKYLSYSHSLVVGWSIFK